MCFAMWNETSNLWKIEATLLNMCYTLGTRGVCRNVCCQLSPEEHNGSLNDKSDSEVDTHNRPAVDSSGEHKWLEKKVPS